jgi:hypothetical protein
MTLQQAVLNQLKSGTRVVRVPEPDEALAVYCCTKAAEAVAPGQVQVISPLGNGQEPIEVTLAQFRDNGKGVLIIPDLMLVNSGSPGIARIVREFALKPNTAKNRAHIILIETLGVEVPAGLKGDLEHVVMPMPGRDEVKDEIRGFVKTAKTEAKLDIGPANDEVLTSWADAVAGLSRHEISRLLSRCVVENKKLDAEWLRRMKARRIGEQMNGAIEFIEPGDSPDVGGNVLLREYLDKRKKAFASAKAREYGLSEPKGILLVGYPGTGKSLTAKSVARSWALPLIRLDVGKLFGGIVGESEAKTRQALSAIEACAPCVLWIDEVEKAFGGQKNGEAGRSDGGTSTRMFGALLTWMSEKSKPIYVLCTANSVEALPPELLRKGRFDNTYFVDLPDESEREEIALIHLKRKKRQSVISAKEFAAMTAGYSGAEIEGVLEEALNESFADGEREVAMADLKAVVKTTVPLSKTQAKEFEQLRLWAREKARPANKRVEPEKPDAGSDAFRSTMIK